MYTVAQSPYRWVYRDLHIPPDKLGRSALRVYLPDASPGYRTCCRCDLHQSQSHIVGCTGITSSRAGRPQLTRHFGIHAAAICDLPVRAACGPSSNSKKHPGTEHAPGPTDKLGQAVPSYAVARSSLTILRHGTHGPLGTARYYLLSGTS